MIGRDVCARLVPGKAILGLPCRSMVLVITACSRVDVLPHSFRLVGITIVLLLGTLRRIVTGFRPGTVNRYYRTDLALDQPGRGDNGRRLGGAGCVRWSAAGEDPAKDHGPSDGRPLLPSWHIFAWPLAGWLDISRRIVRGPQFSRSAIG